MARKKISEFTAKSLLHTYLDLPYSGLSFSVADTQKKLQQLSADTTYVVKVDEGVKKRMKNGLVLLDVPANQVEKACKKLFAKGYSHVIIEPFLPHVQQEERYLSLERVRDGIQVLYSEKGGIDIEDNQDSIKRILYKKPEDALLLPSLQKLLSKLLKLFDVYHLSFLEINPLVIQGEKITFLDIAAQVDDTAAFFVQDSWNEADFRTGVTREKTAEEKSVQQLADKSQAAFSLEVLNGDGSIFMLLSGGGASIVLADEVYNQGYGRELANYGEYSGNPKGEETYIYAKNILSLLLKSKAKKKVLIIAGGVANFTDVRITFKGLIKALEEVKKQLKEQKVSVFVRRGGPYQAEGLALMDEFLEKAGLFGVVAGPDMVLTDIVTKALDHLREGK